MRNIVERLTSAVTNRYRSSALGMYGAGLGCDCGDCPVPTPDLVVPAPRDRRLGTTEHTQPAHVW